MRILLLLNLILGAFLTFPSSHMSSERTEIPTLSQKPNTLKLSVVPDKRIYKSNDSLRLYTMLINNDYVNDIFIYGTLGWGYSASLTFTIRNASGKEIHSQIVPDALTPPISSDDTTAFVKLRPNHYLGTDLVVKLDLLNMSKPGKYSVLVEYHSPISSTDVKLKPFWGKEKPAIKSNLVWIEVVR